MAASPAATNGIRAAHAFRRSDDLPWPSERRSILPMPLNAPDIADTMKTKPHSISRRLAWTSVRAISSMNIRRDGIVKVARELQIFLRARHTAVQLDVALPSAIALRREFKQRQDERFGDQVNRYRLRRFAPCFEKLDATPAQFLDAPGEDLAEQLLLRAEVVINERQVDFRALGDVAGGHRIEVTLRKERFSGIHEALLGAPEPSAPLLAWRHVVSRAGVQPAQAYVVQRLKRLCPGSAVPLSLSFTASILNQGPVR